MDHARAFLRPRPANEACATRIQNSGYTADTLGSMGVYRGFRIQRVVMPQSVRPKPARRTRAVTSSSCGKRCTKCSAFGGDDVLGSALSHC